MGQTDGQTDTRGGLEQEVAQKPRRQPLACLDLFTRLQGAVKGRGVLSGSGGSLRLGLSLPPTSTLGPGLTAGSRHAQDTGPAS